MHRRTVLYRGSLKSCNYRCSYCPFAKHRALASELEQDRRNFERFCASMEQRAESFSIGAVFVTPYGEASIHRWYWEGLSRLAALPGIHRVGMQTNLSFSIEASLRIFDMFGVNDPGGFPEESWTEPCSIGGGHPGQESADSTVPERFSGQESTDRTVPERLSGQESMDGEAMERKREKLCIWATFHPEMTTVDEFAARCHKLVQNGINVCAGAVGVPENMRLVRNLRETLSSSVYLWVNKMDGLNRRYTQEEIASFTEVDPFFGYELHNPPADASMCTDRCFVEADGRIHTCNISRAKAVNWYDGSEEAIFEPVCSRKRCSCYLAYGGRTDFALRDVFDGYPVFRVPGGKDFC